MIMFSDCSGGCGDCVTFYSGGCLAGHGDDDFTEITEEHVAKILDWKKRHNSKDLKWTIEALQKRFPDLNIS